MAPERPRAFARARAQLLDSTQPALVRDALLPRMRLPHLLVCAVVVAGLLPGCDGDHDHDATAPTAQLEVVVDANVGSDRPAVEVSLNARQIAVEPSGDVLIAGAFSVSRVDARTGVA